MTHDGLRAQKTARAAVREVEEHVTKDDQRRQKAPPAGAWPGILAEPGPQPAALLRDDLPTLRLPVQWTPPPAGSSRLLPADHDAALL